MNSRVKNEISKSDVNNLKTAEKLSGKAVEKMMDAIKSVQHGTVQVHIQDGRIIQIDKIDKIRLR
ncbi:MAG: DUF2292 domain-containing protein [Candidatus Omnitrophica bacterium]|nr:DUF2292 domain-containing protein [Candidatus Omnitrophota bacterium]